MTHIVHFLLPSTQSVLRLGMASRTARAACTSDDIWLPLLLSRYPSFKQPTVALLFSSAFQAWLSRVPSPAAPLPDPPPPPNSCLEDHIFLLDIFRAGENVFSVVLDGNHVAPKSVGSRLDPSRRHFPRDFQQPCTIPCGITLTIQGSDLDHSLSYSRTLQ